jgi:hypothetical protein
MDLAHAKRVDEREPLLSLQLPGALMGRVAGIAVECDSRATRADRGFAEVTGLAYLDPSAPDFLDRFAIA